MASDSPPASARGVSWVFLGPQGIRAGWGVLLFAVIWLALSLGAQWVCVPLVHWTPGAPMPPDLGIVMEVCQLIPAIIATWILSIIERRPVTAYGFQGDSRMLRLFSGMLWGFVAISSLVLTLWKLGYLALGRTSLSPSAVLGYAAVWGFVFLMAGFFEESLFRGYIQFALTRGIGFWWGALLFAGIFGLTHRMNPGESPIGLASVVGAALFFSLSLWYTGSLWWAVGFHATWDWGQSFFYGTADSGVVSQGHLFDAHPQGPLIWSGGTTGPEGSVLVLLWLAVMALLMALWWGRRVRSPFRGGAWKPKKDLFPAALPQASWSDAPYR
ncbi:MAG TPA: CPBP family intramembrane glutamic endopeptidase [Acidobacteriaceae bacterium]|nr:CPBP family intramembrane glutamic endopeptidase [Acidobacteriaceae bacterium]